MMVRALIQSRGGDAGLYDPSWVREDEALLEKVAANPAEHVERIGAAFVMSVETTDLLKLLLRAGLRMPAIFTSCQTYLLEPYALRTLLDHGMPPDQMNWQHQTLLHHAAAHDKRECAVILAGGGALTAPESRPLPLLPHGWPATSMKMFQAGVFRCRREQESRHAT